MDSPSPVKKQKVYRRKPRVSRKPKIKIRIGTEKIEMVKHHRIRGLVIKKKMNWGAHRKTLMQIHQMIILSTLRYGKTVYGLASKAVLRQLDPIHHRGVRVALGTFAVCKTEKVLCEAGLPTLTEMRDENTDRNKNIDEQKPPY
jgi:hypothetical protein